MAAPKFARQHYEAIAEVICQNARPNTSPVPGGDLVFLDDLVSALAELFEKDNPAFSRDKFTDACYGRKAKR